MLDKNLPPTNPGIPLPINPPPFPPVPLDPVRLEAAFKVQNSQEYADLKAALGDFGRVNYGGKSYSANSLDRLVGELVNSVELRDQPRGADYIADQVKGILKGLTDTLHAPPTYRVGDEVQEF